MPHKVTLSVPTGQEVISSRPFRWGVTLVFCAASFFGGMYVENKREAQGVDNVIRQLRGDLTDKEKKLLEQDASINKLRTDLKTEHQLKVDAERDLGYKIDELNRIKKDNSLEIDSLTKIIAELKGKDNGGHHTVTTDGKVTTVRWCDAYDRFHLFIPDLNKSESYFTYDQHFKVSVVVLRQQKKDGALRIQTAHLYELDGNGNVIAEGKINTDLSTFEYAIQDPYGQPARHWLLTLTSSGEGALTWLPVNRFNNMLGFGLTAGAGKDTQFVGLTAMVFPPTWQKTGFGVGASVGYQPNHNGLAFRVQASWSFGDALFGK